MEGLTYPISLQIKWNRDVLDVTLSADSTIGDLKAALEAKTKVPVNAQKLMGVLVKGKMPVDSTPLSSLNLKPKQQIMLIGTPESQIREVQDEQQAFALQARLEEEEEQARRAEEARRTREAERLRKEAEQRREEERARQRAIDEAERKRRMEEERRQQLEMEIAQEVDENARISFSYPCFSAAHANLGALEQTNKIILPPSVLQDLVNKKIQLPVIFEIVAKSRMEEATRKMLERANQPSQQDEQGKEEQEEEGREELQSSSLSRSMDSPVPFLHVAVHDFTCADHTCCIPTWMMSCLGMVDGDILTLRSVRLQKGTFVKLKPLSKEWTALSKNNSMKANLEERLRRYQTLSVGDLVHLYHGGVWLVFKVLQVMPENEENAIDIQNTDLSVDLLDYEPPEFQESAEEQGMEWSPTHSVSESEQAEQVQISAEPVNVSASLKADQYKRYSLSLSHTPDVSQTESLLLQITSVKGDADIYVSINGAGDARGFPSLLHHDFCIEHTQNMSNSKSIVIPLLVSSSAHDSNPSSSASSSSYSSFSSFSSSSSSSTSSSVSSSSTQFISHLNLSVHAYEADTDFTLTMTPARSNATYLLGENKTAGPGYSLCANCLKYVPTSSLSLHELQCMRKNWRCPLCDQVVSKNEQRKHEKLSHTPFFCECGTSLLRSEMPSHMRESCPLRLLACVYCGLVVIAAERGEHQGQCGNRTLQCTFCTQLVKRKEVVRHLQQHGVELPNNFTEQWYSYMR